jgi:alginate O-acetyltransferase complex protein AlgI
LGALAGRVLTFGSVVVAWVFFRAASMDTAFAILGTMFPFNRIALSEQIWWPSFEGVLSVTQDWFLLTTILPLLFIVFFAPNTQEWVGYGPQPGTPPPGRKWMHALSTRPLHAMAMACLLFVALSRVSKMSVFLYFNF